MTAKRLPAKAAQRGSAMLEGVAALGVAAMLLGGAASEGASSSRALADARSLAHALTLARNVLDRALAAPCASAAFATDACEQPFRCTVGAETLGMRAGATGNVLVVRLRAEILAGEAGIDEHALVRLATVAARPANCS